MTGCPRVAAVVVTRNRVDELRACLTAIRGQTRPADMVIVVDNASGDGTAEYLACESGVRTLHSDQNLGGAGGFAWGLEAGLAQGADWIWLMDDDALPGASCLQNLLATGEGNERLGAVAPVVMHRGWLDVCGYQRGRLHGNRSRQVLLSDTANQAVIVIDWAPFPGLLVRAAAARQVGRIRSDFFIWCDDCEYCLRLRAAGWEIACMTGAFVVHPAPRRPITKIVLGRELSVGDTPAWREYYGTRNSLLVDALYADTEVGDGTTWARRVLRQFRACAVVALVDRDHGWRRAYWRLRGIWDAVRGRTGIGPLP